MSSKLIRRPAEMTTNQDDCAFSRTVVHALEVIGVAPGQDFAVSTPEHVRARARRGDPETSRQAARSVADLSGSQADVLKVFRDHGHGRGFTDEELLRAYRRGTEAGVVRRQSDSGVRSRRAELAVAGFVVDTGRRATTRAGRETIIWALAEHVEPTPKLQLVEGGDDRLFEVDGILVPRA